MRCLRWPLIAGLLGLGSAFCLVANSYQLYLMALVGLTTMVGVGLNILFGLSGQVSLGHVGFYAIGAYTSAILTTATGSSFWLVLLLAGGLTGLVGTILALPALRVTGPYLAMVTIAFGFIVEHGTVEWRALTGGANGLMNIPLPTAFGYAFGERDMTLLIGGLTAVWLWLFWRLRRSPWGLALRAVRDAEVAAQSLGLNPLVLRTVAFTLSAASAGVAGALYAPLTTFVSPSAFSFGQSILFLLGVIVGGSGTVFGPLIGAALVVLLPEFLAGLAEYRLPFFGALLLLVLWLTPEGVVGALSKRLRRTDRTVADADGIDVLAWLRQQASGQALKVDNLSLAFGGLRAVTHVGFTAYPGQVTSLIGPNGAGKTTVLNILSGLSTPDIGSVMLGTRQLVGLPAYAVARAGLARTYQTTQLFPTMSVLDNLLIALRHGRLGMLLSVHASARCERELLRTAAGLLAFVGYAGPLRQPAAALAHGDKRMVEIARALAMQPQVLVLDEPAAGLGPRDAERLGTLLRQVASAGMAVVLVEHNMQLVMGVSDAVVVLDAGRVLAAGNPAQVRQDAAVRTAYLGGRTLAGRPRRAAGPDVQECVLTVQQLSAGYGAAAVLEGIDLAVQSGELVAVLGANGAGKSTLMRALSGLHRPVWGTVRLRRQPIMTLAAHRISRAGLVLVPEGRQVFPELTVLDNIRLGAYSHRTFDVRCELEPLLVRFPALRQRLHSRAGVLSGGEQQMLALARGLVARPMLLLLDEPSLGLAPALIDTLFGVLAELREAGTTILLVDQMIDLALSVADRGYVLKNGRIVHAGPTAELQNDPALERAYLGEADEA
jgi:ABC-type branched-subunit amino acid transport system ATPase component/ABC-type branched-subunit amino acid transport system permease subunit